jgi:RND family efflux transporter MFP subunit
MAPWVLAECVGLRRGSNGTTRHRRNRGPTFTLACALALAMADRAQSATFDCVIEPALTLKLGSPIASILDKVEVDRGDLVKQGQVIARLESTVDQAVVAVNRARAESTAEIEAKQAVLDQKKGVLNRKLGLQRSSYASAQDIETAQAEYNVAEQDLALAKLNRRMAELDLRRTEAALEQRTIRSPIDGVVVKRSLGPGEYVHQEANIVTLARIDPLNVETFLPIRYYGHIKVGDTAKIRPDDPVGGDRTGTVSIVDEVFDAASGTFGVRLELANPEHLVPAGLRCRITFGFPEQPAEAPVVGFGRDR